MGTASQLLAGMLAGVWARADSHTSTPAITTMAILVEHRIGSSSLRLHEDIRTAERSRPSKRSSRKAQPRKQARRPRAQTETPPFERVWRLVRRIPRGKVATYGQLSELIDRRLTPVGVGWAIQAAGETAIPWHRVVNGRGGISTDKQHPGLQRALLEAEGVRFGRDGLIDLARYGWRGPARK